MDTSSTQDGDLTEPILIVPPPEGEETSPELEETLSDTSLTTFQRYKKATSLELYSLTKLAAPAIIMYLLNNVTSMSTQIFCGHLGNLQLAAASLGNNGVQLFVFGVMVCCYLHVFFII